LRKAALFRGVQPVLFESDKIPYIETNARALEKLMEREGLEDGDLVLITKGDAIKYHGGTNTMKILQVGTKIT